MKNRWRPFITQVQQTLSNLSTKRLAPLNPQAQLSLPARAESRVWEPIPTPEQEASYEKHLDEMPATPDWILGLRKDSLYKGSLASASKDTVEVRTVNPDSQADTIMSHMCGDTPDQFAAVIGQLIAPTIQNKAIIPHVPTSTLPGTKPQITGSLRRVTISDPYLSSVQTTPNHEFAIVPRQRATAQLPPRLGDDTADAPEHRTSVQKLVEQRIAALYAEKQRLPLHITVSFIRYAQHWMNTGNYNFFTYQGAMIPISGAAIGAFLVDEVRLD